MVAEQNERHISTGHYSKQRDILDYYLSRKTEPTETILQVGNHEDCNLPSDELWKIYINDYLPEFKKRYGSRVKILNSCLHCDEPGATPHIHERLIFIGHNSHGEPCSNKNQALKELGFELPDPSKPESRYNTRLMEYSKQCRQLWIECCQRHGLEIDVIPGNPGKHGLELAKYKANKEEERLYQAQEELSNLQNEKALLESNIQGLQEYVNRNSKSIRSWKNEVENKINAINNVMEEYEAFSSDAEKRYSQEVREYILNALGDVPEEPEETFNQATTGFNSYNYDEEDYELS